MPENTEDGPPKLSDLNNKWTVASLSEDNVLQVWNMAKEIYAEDDDEMSIEEEEEDDTKEGMGQTTNGDDLEYIFSIK